MQFENILNVQSHYLSTGKEIIKQIPVAENIDAFFSGAGTGGTLSGVGKYLKEQNPNIKVIAIDPVGSLYYDYFHTGQLTQPHSYLLEGIGEDFLPTTMNFDYVDSMISVTDKQAFDMCQRMSETEGILAGGSGGLNVHGCVELSGRIDAGTIVTVLPDSGIKYLSKIYSTEWRREKGFGKEREDDAQRETSAEIIRTAMQDRDPFQGVLSN